MLIADSAKAKKPVKAKKVIVAPFDMKQFRINKYATVEKFIKEGLFAGFANQPKLKTKLCQTYEVFRLDPKLEAKRFDTVTKELKKFHDKCKD